MAGWPAGLRGRDASPWVLDQAVRNGYVLGVSRPREFDADVALTKTMEVFWQRGYDGASISDLSDAAGVGRQSLYLAFGDKRALYLAALDRYRELFQAPLLVALEEGSDLRAVLRSALVALVDGSCGPASHGCMLVNAATERAPHDEEVRSRVAAAFRALENALVEALDVAHPPSGSHHRSHRSVARLLCTTIQGLRLTAAVNPDPNALLDTIDTALAVLDR